MVKDINKKLFLERLSGVPILIIMDNGNLIASNKIRRDTFAGIDQDISFYDLFDSDDINSLKQNILSSRIHNTIFKGTYNLDISQGGSKPFEVTVAPFRKDDSTEYFVTFIPAEDTAPPLNIYIYHADLDNILRDVELRNLIGKIKSSFPFTFIGKVKVANEIETLDFPIWVKDGARKFLLSNKKYASLQEMSKKDIEGKEGGAFLPEFNKELFNEVDEFIEESSNSVILERKLVSPHSGNVITTLSAEIPIYDIDKTVIGYIGFSKSLNEKEFVSDNPIAIKFIKTNNNEVKGDMDDLVIHTSPEPIFIYEIENLKFIEVNDAALKLYGYRRDEFLQMDLTDLYAPEDIQTLIESSSQKSMLGTFSGPWRHKKKNGSSILLEIGKSSIDYKGKKAHLNILRDVTDIIELKTKLKEYKATFDNASDLVFITDKEGFITYSNESVKNILGYSKSDLQNTQIVSLLSEEFRGNVNSTIFQSGGKDSISADVAFRKNAGSSIEGNLMATPIENYEGEIVSYNFTIKIQSGENTTASVPTEGASVQVSGDQSDPSFLSNLFHELLTPVTVLIGLAREIIDNIEEPTEDQKEASEIIQENQKLLMHTMDTAAEYASLQSNQFRISPTNIKFIDMLDEIQNNTKKVAQSRGIEFSYGKISSSLIFESDLSKFQTLLSVFIKFALQITSESRLYLSAYQLDNDNCIVSLRDKRAEISEKLNNGLDDVMEKDEAEVRHTYGFSRFEIRLTRRLLSLLNGRKEIVNKNGAPAEFGFVFPIKFVESTELGYQTKQDKLFEEKKVEQTESPVPEPEPPAAEKPVPTEIPPAPAVAVEQEPVQEAEPEELVVVKSSAPPKDFALKDLTALYVEDQIDSQILFKVQMKELKSIEFANSVENALPLLQSQKFDFVVLDMNLQGEYNGLDALRIIQQLPGYENVPVIAATAYVLPGDREKFIAAGFTDFLSKPILRDKMTDILSKVVV